MRRSSHTPRTQRKETPRNATPKSSTDKSSSRNLSVSAHLQHPASADDPRCCLDFLSEKELVLKSDLLWDETAKVDVRNVQPSVAYKFGAVFPPKAKTTQVFRKTILPMIDKTLWGKDALFVLYGKQHSGKTKMMLGHVLSDGISGRGLLELTLRRFVATPGVSNVRLSAVEAYSIHTTQIQWYDLLNPTNCTTVWAHKEPIDVFAGKNSSNIIRVTINKRSPIKEIIAQAYSSSRIAPTGSNPFSSRSHCVYIIRVTVRHNQQTFMLIDFAGTQGSDTLTPKVSGIADAKLRRLESGPINYMLSQFQMLLVEMSRSNLLSGLSTSHPVSPFDSQNATRSSHPSFSSDDRRERRDSINQANLRGLRKFLNLFLPNFEQRCHIHLALMLSSSISSAASTKSCLRMASVLPVTSMRPILYSRFTLSSETRTSSNSNGTAEVFTFSEQFDADSMSTISDVTDLDTAVFTPKIYEEVVTPRMSELRFSKFRLEIELEREVPVPPFEIFQMKDSNGSAKPCGISQLPTQLIVREKSPSGQTVFDEFEPFELKFETRRHTYHVIVENVHRMREWLDAIYESAVSASIATPPENKLHITTSSHGEIQAPLKSTSSQTEPARFFGDNFSQESDVSEKPVSEKQSSTKSTQHEDVSTSRSLVASVKSVATVTVASTVASVATQADVPVVESQPTEAKQRQANYKWPRWVAITILAICLGFWLVVGLLLLNKEQFQRTGQRESSWFGFHGLTETQVKNYQDLMNHTRSIVQISAQLAESCKSPPKESTAAFFNACRISDNLTATTRRIDMESASAIEDTLTQQSSKRSLVHWFFSGNTEYFEAIDSNFQNTLVFAASSAFMSFLGTVYVCTRKEKTEHRSDKPPPWT